MQHNLLCVNAPVQFFNKIANKTSSLGLLFAILAGTVKCDQSLFRETFFFIIYAAKLSYIKELSQFKWKIVFKIWL